MGVWVWVEIDVAKELHWACAVDDTGQVVLDHQLDNDPAAIQALIEELAALGQGLVVGMDVVGGIANLIQAMLAVVGFRLVYVSRLAVNRARQATRGGETKSDPRDARVIADQVRTRGDLRPIQPSVELDLEIHLLAGRRRDLTDEQTRRLSRLHDLLASVHPGLERTLDLTTKGGLWLISRLSPRPRSAPPATRSSWSTRGPPAACPSARSRPWLSGPWPPPPPNSKPSRPSS